MSGSTPVWFRRADGSLEVKDPADIDDWVLDLSGSCVVANPTSGATTYDPITGTPTVTANPTDMIVSAIGLAVGKGGADTAVGWWLSGGTAGMNYEFTVKAQTVGGRTLERSVWLVCGNR